MKKHPIPNLPAYAGNFLKPYATRLQGWWRRLLVLFLVILGAAEPAVASHFRFGNLSWAPTTNPNEVKFNLTGAFRRSAYGGTGADGQPIVGDVFTETTGATSFLFGDGSGTGTLQFRVIAFSAVDNYVIGEALNPGTQDAGILHTYAGPGPFNNVGISSCCRVSSPTLNNRPDGQYTLFTSVTPQGGNKSPVSSQVPIVSVTQGPASSFTVPASDPDGDGVRFRVSTDAESGNSGASPPGLTIDPNSGVATWNTVGLNTVNFWTVQIIIEDLDATGAVKTRTPVDFLLKINQSTSTPPDLTINPPGPFNVLPGTPINFNVLGTDVDAGSTVTLNTGGLPGSATMTPGLPQNGPGSPGVSSDFNWTPGVADVGGYVVAYTVLDNTGGQTQRSVQINVSSLPAPTVVTTPATLVGMNGATLNGTVNPNGVATTYRFEYGTTTLYGNSTAPIFAGSGNAPVNASELIGLLAPNTEYHFRIVAASAGGNSVGDDLTFRTTGTTNIPPTVTLGEPHDNATVTELDSVLFTATADDADGSVVKVEFFMDGTKLGEDANAPYELTAGPFAVGVYSITAVATDNVGDSVPSAAHTLNVVEAVPIARNDNAFAPPQPVKTAKGKQLVFANINPLKNDDGPAGLALTIIAVGGTPTKGTVTITNNGTRLKYTVVSPLSPTESDSFTYTVQNSIGRVATATVTVYPAPLQGSHFVSILRDQSGVAQGFVTYYFTRTGAATGTITYAGRRFSFRLGINGDSPVIVQVRRGRAPTPPLLMEVGAGPVVDGSVTLATDVLDPTGLAHWNGDAVLSPFFKRKTASNLTPRGGLPPARYSLGLSADPTHDGDPAYPQGGTGISFNVTTNGLTRWVGRTPDGVSISGGTSLLTGERIPFFFRTGSKARPGKLVGELNFQPGAGPELTGSAKWDMPALAGSTFFPAGFSVDMAAIGCRYTRPANATGLLSSANLIFNFTDGRFINPLSINFTVSPLVSPRGNPLPQGGPAPLIITKIGLSAGFVNGSIRNPDTGKGNNFWGVALQDPSLNRVHGMNYDKAKTAIGEFTATPVNPP